MNRAEFLPPEDSPAPDARIPAVVVRLMFALAGILLTLDVYGTKAWLGIGIILACLAAWAPDLLFAWLLILFLAGGQFTHHGTLTSEFLVLLGGLHLLHILGSLSLGLPWRTWVQPTVLVRSLQRFLAIQVQVQLVAVAVLLLLAPNSHGHRPVTAVELTLVGAAALGCLGLLLLRRAD